MNFIAGLPRTPKGNNSVWVIVDRLTKSTHFLPVKNTFTMDQYAGLYIREIIRLHGTPVSIVSDQDSRFTSHFWDSLQKALGTELKFNTTFHLQIDSQSEHVIQVLDDMMKACVLNFQRSWEEHIPTIEFAYNNSYQASIGMAPFEALYGRRCRSLVCWTEVGERQLIGPEMIQVTS